MSRKTIKLGIIGLGEFGKKILKPISFLHSKEELEVHAICDTNLNLAQSIAEENNIPYYFNSHQEMLSNTNLDLIYIATPPATHEAVVLDVLEHNIHVFCEKPLAKSGKETENMLLKAEQANVVHAVHFGQNYTPQINKFHQLIKSDYIGELLRINLTMHYLSWPPESQQNSWISSREQGGFLLEQGVHFINIIQRTFGKITHVHSKVNYPDSTSCEDSVIATMLLENGTQVLIDGLIGIAGEENVSLTAYGTEGTITFKNFKVLLVGKTGQPLKKLNLDRLNKDSWIMKHIIDAIHGKPAKIYDFSKGYESQVVLEALRKGENKLIDLSTKYL
jgi:predicted dehydrogenase